MAKLSQRSNSRISYRYFGHTSNYYKTLIYKSPIISPSSSNIDKLKAIIIALDINLKLSQRSKEDSYLRNLIKKNLKNIQLQKYLLKLRLNLIINLALEGPNLKRAINGIYNNL